MNSIKILLLCLALSCFSMANSRFVGYPLQAGSCSGCYQKYSSCIDEYFSEGFCCADGLCKSRYKYCSDGLTSSKYKMLTCPLFDCPNGPVEYVHNDTTHVETATRSWPLLKSGFNCKYIIKADSTLLNGKLNVEIT